MSDKIGVLGRGTTSTQGVTTVYTCPAAKAAKLKVMYRGASGTNSTLKLTVAGIDVFLSAALTAGYVHYSANSLLYNVATAAGAVDATTEAKMVAPFTREYMLQAGDQVKYTIGTADFTSFQMDVIGAEVDV